MIFHFCIYTGRGDEESLPFCTVLANALHSTENKTARKFIIYIVYSYLCMMHETFSRKRFTGSKIEWSDMG